MSSVVSDVPMAQDIGPQLSERRNSWTYIRALMRKNWLLKKRHWVATAMEIALPMMFVLLLGVLKSLMQDVTVPSGWSDTTSTGSDAALGTSYNLFTPTGTTLPWIPTAVLPKFNMHETSLSGLLLSLGLQSFSDGVKMQELSTSDLTTCEAGVVYYGDVSLNTSSAYSLPTACDNKVVPYKIGIAPDTPFTRDYLMQTMALWYPRVKLSSADNSTQIPSFEDSVFFFDTADDLETYVSGSDYGKDLSNPKIYGAIVFDTYPDENSIGQFVSMEYTLRLNSTASQTGTKGRIPSTSGDPSAVDSFQRDIVVDYYSRYTVLGFMTLQTLVTRFVTCMPEWDTATKTTTGVCQRTQATAPNSTALDERLLNTYSSDAMLQVALSGTSTSFTSFFDALTDDAKEQLLVPLRQVPQPYLGGSVAPFPVEAYVDSPFYSSIKTVFALIFILAYLYSVSRILVVFIQEKELRMREFMKILGVKEKCIMISWYLTYTIIMFLGAVLQTLASLIGLFPNCSPVLLLVFFFLFGMTVLSYGYLVSTIFSKSRTGAFVGMIVFFLMYFISTVFSTNTAESAKTIGCLLSPIALAQGATVLANLESTGQGIGFGNMSTVNENFRFSTALMMMALDTLLYTILGLYFERVVPKDWGTTLKWYYPVSPSYWRGRRKTQKGKLEGPHADEALLDRVVLDVNPNFEPVTSDMREQERRGEALSVQRLRKVFPVPGGEKVAVQGMNLVMYKNQITCLLGHNGAGKTTLISMLTGMTAASSGDATFRGLSLNEDMEEMRESLGICFQHDVLFGELTVEEHLQFFAQIKGYSSTELQEVVDKQIREVGLTEKRHVASSALSGGMKRKLSVAICLLGDSSLVFLDEPTSGMDPYSRRSTWEILLNNRNERVMVLTTHFMDEADILGDRIAIMSEGELRCCGSSLFLKNRYGAGYNLTLVKDDGRCNDNDVIALVSSYIPNAQLLSNVGSEISFQLPLASSGTFARMFAAMDDSLNDLGLLSYGISVTTLEEVFIKVAEANDEDHQHTLSKKAANGGLPPLDILGPSRIETGIFMTHLRALIFKRFRVAKRDKKMLFYSVGLPVFLLLAGLLLLQASGLTSNDPKLALTTDDLTTADQSPTPYYCQAESGDTSSAWCSNVVSSSFFTGALPKALSDSLMTPFDTDSPTVFNVTYTSPLINSSDATGYGLRLGEQVFNLGYGQNGTYVEGQYGAFLVYGSDDANMLSYNLFVNTSATHGSVIFKALMDQSIYRFFASNTSVSSSSSSSVDLKVNSYPLPLSKTSKALMSSSMAFLSCIFIVIAFTYFPAAIVVFLVKERQSEHNSKHQQLVSGVSLPAFWMSNYIWDMGMYAIPCISAVVLIQLFDISAMTGNDCTSCTSATFPTVILLFVLFGFAICPFTYCLSYMFKEHASSQMYTIMINFFLGVVLMIVSFILDQIDSTESANSVLKFLWRFSPLFSLGNGLLTLSLHEIKALMYSEGKQTSPFSGNIMGYELLYLFLTAIVFTCLAVGIDYSLTFPKKKAVVPTSADDSMHEDDIDVIKEAERVNSGAADQDIVRLKDLRKVYPGGKYAVRNLTFGLKRGECFGFLGINGAGKTTTMKMLTGDVAPSYGTATLCGFDILTQQIEVRREIGYCPQFDALFDLMTVREHLELFASIKGIPSNQLKQVVDDKIVQLNLSSFTDKLAGSLSGGNKRKLSVAIAMIGNPRIIFLDEPSTGMDPVSRRFMWDVIADVSTRGKASTIVLTTHSMEEAEALCSRVGIMVGGRMRCLGSVQHLKSRFGDGLAFDVKLQTPTQEELSHLVMQMFGEENHFLTPMEVQEKCDLFGNSDLAERVVAGHPTGYAIASALERDGFVRAEAFCSWCAEELLFDDLNEFLEKSFGVDNVMVMERQNDFYRFKLRGSNDSLKLSKVFELVEGVKSKLHIREYSVSQTTLEQIFNYFASQQAEEQGVARGVFHEA